MGIPEGRLNIAVSEDILHGNHIDSRHDSSIRCGKVVVTDAPLNHGGWRMSFVGGGKRCASFYSFLLRLRSRKKPQIRTSKSPVIPTTIHPYTQEESSLQYSKINCQNLTIFPLYPNCLSSKNK